MKDIFLSAVRADDFLIDTFLILSFIHFVIFFGQFY